MTNLVISDGGRAAAGWRGIAGDCAARSIAIATQVPYQVVYDMINVVAQKERLSKRKRTRSSARDGVHTNTVRKVMTQLGWQWHATMGIGTGCQVHLRPGELPKGRLVVVLSRHYTAMIDGVIHDMFDCSRDGTRCVYGYFTKPESKPK